MSDATQTSFVRVWLVIWKREMIRFLRQPSRIAAAIGTPVMLWLFLGVGLSKNYAPTAAGESTGAQSYALFLLPGMITMVALFSAVFSSISVIEDRSEGWLQSVLIAPVPRSALVFGKVAGGSTVAFLQAVLLLLAAPVLGHWPGPLETVVLLVAIALTSVLMTTVGLALAWRCESTQGFHAVMNLVLMPMWALSGSIFPVSSQHVALKSIMMANPLTWCSLAIRSSWEGGIDFTALTLAGVFTVVGLVVATMIVTSPEKGARPA